MRTPARVANQCLVFASVLFALSLVSGEVHHITEGVVALLVAGQLVGGARD